MEEKLVTIVVLPYSRAHLLKMRFEAKGIECVLENIDLMEGSASSSVRIKILEKDLREAIPVMEEMLGIKPFVEPIKEEKAARHILLPVDFSVHSEKACKMAFNIAGHLQSKVILFHCYVNPLIHNIPYSDVYAYDSSLISRIEMAEKNANEHFQQFVAKMSKEIGREKWDAVAPEFIIKSGYADNDILNFAHKNHSLLIVIGSGGKEDTGTVGSVAVHVMYNAQLPVLVVPEDTPEKELTAFRNILYATNFDEKDFVALDKLMNIVKPFDVKITCAHVGQPSGNGWDLARLEGMAEILHQKYGEKNFECKLIVGKNILQSLEQYIESEGVDILSLTTHKKNMISRLFNPSLARRMVFHTHTPLFVFHA